MAEFSKTRKTQRASDEEVGLFVADIMLLRSGGYSMQDIADRIPNLKDGKSITDTNLTNYFKLVHAITKNFLIRFYTPWQEVITSLKGKIKGDYPTDPLPQTMAKFDESSDQRSFRELIKTLQENNGAMQSNLTMVIETNRKLADSNEMLAKNNKRLVDHYLQSENAKTKGKNPGSASGNKPRAKKSPG